MRNSLLVLVLLLSSVIVSAQSTAHPATAPTSQPHPKSDATILLESVSKQYANAHSYADDGEVTVVSLDPPPRPDRVKFQTRFVRDRGFSFKETQVGLIPLSMGIWLEKDTLWFTDFEGHVETMKNLAAGLSGMAGVSHTVSFVVTPLLFPNEFKNTPFFWNPGDASILGEEIVGGVACIWIQMLDVPAKPVQLWIGREDKLIHRQRTITETRTQRTIDFRPRMNIDIDAKELILDRTPLAPTTGP